MCKELKIPKGSRGSLHTVLEEVQLCAKAGIPYVGTRKCPSRARAKIPLDSVEAQIVADYMEDGYGLRQTTAQVNKYRQDQAEDDSWVRVGVSAVYSCYLALDPVVTAVEDVKQGKHDPEATWSVASYNWVTYLMVRFGQLSDAELSSWMQSSTIVECKAQ